MLTYSFSAAKLKRGSMSRAKGHNQREHVTASQLPKSAWLSPDGNVTRYTWQEDKVERATSLVRRKDAVIGIEMTFQVGDQTDWRHPPTKEHPFGKPKQPRPADLKRLEKGIRAFLLEEFGEANVVSLVLHMDESTPHFQAVVTAERDGKLNAKHWTGGPAKLAQLWQRSHAHISKHLPCTYTPGSGRGGKPHDPGKAAGSTPPPEGLLDKLTSLPALRAENAKLRERVDELEQQLFSRQKARYSAARIEELTLEVGTLRDERDAARKSAKTDQALAASACSRVSALEAELGDMRQQAEQANREIALLCSKRDEQRNRADDLQRKLDALQPKQPRHEHRAAPTPRMEP